MNTEEKWEGKMSMKQKSQKTKNQSKAKDSRKDLKPKNKEITWKEKRKLSKTKTARKQSVAAGNGSTTHEGKGSDMNVISSHIHHCDSE